LTIAPDERAFDADIASARFTAGVDRGQWKVLKGGWPNPVITLYGGSNQVTLRFDLNGYPGVAPTACPWDADADQALPPERWPRGGRVSEVFRPEWNPSALYFPLDRVALQGHDAWLVQQGTVVWTTDSDITAYLRFIRDLLLENESEDAAAAA
jgi:hypothetical protein